MSEFQYVAFRAVDRPLNDHELAFANRQSTRADVSRWALAVEYHESSRRRRRFTAARLCHTRVKRPINSITSRYSHKSSGGSIRLLALAANF